MYKKVYFCVRITNLSRTCTHLSINGSDGRSPWVTCYRSQMVANTSKCFCPLPHIAVARSVTFNEWIIHMPCYGSRRVSGDIKEVLSNNAIWGTEYVPLLTTFSLPSLYYRDCAALKVWILYSIKWEISHFTARDAINSLKLLIYTEFRKKSSVIIGLLDFRLSQ